MGNVINNSVNGKRYATDFPKNPKPPKCQRCKQVDERTNLVRIGGHRYHKACRT